MKTKTPELRSDIDPKIVASRLVSMYGRSEALKTLKEGSASLPMFGNLLYKVSREIQCVRESSQDAFNYRYAGRTRKGGTPSLRRYL